MSSPTRFSQFAPIFPVTDVRRALAYSESLGFETVAYQGGNDYGFAERDGVPEGRIIDLQSILPMVVSKYESQCKPP
jgi:hypothetical protein